MTAGHQETYQPPDICHHVAEITVRENPIGPGEETVVSSDPLKRVGYVAHMTTTALSHLLERELRPLSLTVAQFNAMIQLTLEPEGTLSSAELARRAGVTAQSMSAAIGSLADRGLVDRQRSTDHGRIIELRLTDAGRALLDRAQARAEAVETRTLAPLSEPEREQLRKLMLRIMDGLGLYTPRPL
jgi:DNA-binding MarR family transcriptional regulator